MAAVVALALCGDVMLGRGVDQILPFRGDPALWEGRVRDAREYVRLAEAVNGPIPCPADVSWPWGDALAILAGYGPCTRLLNVETSVTRGGKPAAGKPIHYRMSPGNLPALTVARPDVCTLANNHVLDFGRQGLAETVAALHGAGIRIAGAGRDADAAWQPAAVPAGTGRVVVLAFGTPSSGIPATWAATADRSGVALVPELTQAWCNAIAERLRRDRRPGDVVVVSVHWGSNWGYRIGRDQIRFAHHLIDAGVDVVYGHSSHHPRPLEIYRGRLIMYGCGDLINDYEGIGGHQQFRPELRLLFLAELQPGGELLRLRMAPLRARRLRLWHATGEEARWLRENLDTACRVHGTRVDRDRDGMLTLHPR